MEELSLNVWKREDFGKGPVARLRRTGMLPAVLYGPEMKKNLALKIDGKEVDKILHSGGGTNVILKLKIDGSKDKTAMFKEIQRHPAVGEIQHIDLIEVLMDHKVTVEVPVHVIGLAEGVKLGGIMQQELREVKIECLPGQIPNDFEVDVSELDIGQSLHLSALKLPEGVKMIDEASITIVSIVAPTVVEEPKTAEEIEGEIAESLEEGEEGEAKEETESTEGKE